MNATSVRVKFICRLGYGNSLPKDEEFDGDVPVFGSNGRYATTSARNTDAPAIVLGRKGSYGKVNWAPDGCFASDTTFFVDGRLTTANLRWLYWSLQTLGLDEGSQEAAVPGLNRESVYEKRVHLPSLTTQATIANYLDREIARIDGLIAGKERMLALLEEKRAALISHAVIRGLDPIVPLKPSGQEWLGEIPGHWRLERLKYHLLRIEQGWSPQCDNTPAEMDEWGVLKVGAVNGWTFNSSENKRLPDEIEPLVEYEIKPGDVLMSRANTTQLLGSIAYVQDVDSKLLLCDKLYRLEVADATLDREYLVAFMRARPGRFQLEREASGTSGSMQNIGQDTVQNAWVTIPPLDEQKKISLHINQTRDKTARMEVMLRNSMDLLRERRAVLMTAAVNGQIPLEEMIE